MKIYITGPVAGGRRRTPEEIYAIFSEILALPSYIIEDTGRACFSRGFDECDWIILLNPPKLTHRLRILTRFVRQKLGIEKSGYKPTFKMLRNMFKWVNDFDSGEDNLTVRLKRYGGKLTELNSSRGFERYKSEIFGKSKQ